MAEVAFPPKALPGPMDCQRKMSGLTIKTDLPMSSFPEYKDPFFESSGDTMMESPITMNPAHKLVDKIKGGDTIRHPSPQPTHINYPLANKLNGNGHRVLRSATVGYVAPEFHGKADQMKKGQLFPGFPVQLIYELTSHQSRSSSPRLAGSQIVLLTPRLPGSTMSLASMTSTSRQRAPRSSRTTYHHSTPPRLLLSLAKTSGRRSG